MYVNRALDRFSLLKNRNNPAFSDRLASVTLGTKEVTQIHPRLWILNPRTVLESINWIPFGALHDLINKFNNRRLAKHINAAAQQLGFSDAILINDNDFIRGRYLHQMVNTAFSIFYQRDDMLGIRYFQRHGPRLQEGALRAYDMVATNSAYLAKTAREINPYSFDIGQGCDLEYFRPRALPVPGELKQISKPIIGYIGYVSAWRIDLELLKYLAENLPQYNIVLIGPVDVLFDMEAVKEYSNLYFIESKPVTELPKYINCFDICINPQVLNKATVGNYPRKIDEYLAMGKAVVATETEAMGLFAAFTYLCRTKFDFVEKIRDILAHPDVYGHENIVAGRIAFAQTHTWENSLDRLSNAYVKTKNEKMKDGQPSRWSWSENRLQALAILFVIAYLIYVYIKFLFF